MEVKEVLLARLLVQREEEVPEGVWCIEAVTMSRLAKVPRKPLLIFDNLFLWMVVVLVRI
jgi:hypothetical protein